MIILNKRKLRQSQNGQPAINKFDRLSVRNVNDRVISY